MKLQIDLKDVIVFGLVLLCIGFCLNLYFKMESIKLAQQVNANTQSIQQIVTFLNQQTKPVSQLEQKLKEGKE